MPQLINLGSLRIDQVYRVEELPRPGETVTSISHRTFPVGKGLNQSLAAARAGAAGSIPLRADVLSLLRKQGLLNA